MAQMLKVFGPYFFRLHLSKTGEQRQFSPFQMLAVLQLMEATRIHEPEMFKIYAQQVEQRLEGVKSIEEILTVLTNNTTTLDPIKGEPVSKFFKLYDVLEFAIE